MRTLTGSQQQELVRMADAMGDNEENDARAPRLEWLKDGLCSGGESQHEGMLCG